MWVLALWGCLTLSSNKGLAKSQHEKPLILYRSLFLTFITTPERDKRIYFTDKTFFKASPFLIIITDKWMMTRIWKAVFSLILYLWAILLASLSFSSIFYKREGFNRGISKVSYGSNFLYFFTQSYLHKPVTLSWFLP